MSLLPGEIREFGVSCRKDDSQFFLFFVFRRFPQIVEIFRNDCGTSSLEQSEPKRYSLRPGKMPPLLAFARTTGELSPANPPLPDTTHPYAPMPARQHPAHDRRSRPESFPEVEGTKSGTGYPRTFCCAVNSGLLIHVYPWHNRSKSSGSLSLGRKQVVHMGARSTAGKVQQGDEVARGRTGARAVRRRCWV